MSDVERVLEEGWPSTWQSLPPFVRAAVVSGLYIGAYLALDYVAAAFSIGSDPKVASVWYLPSALTVVTLWTFGLRYGVATYAAVLLAGLVNSPDVPFWSSVIYSFTYTLVFGAAVFALQKLRVNPRLYSVRDVGLFLFVAAFLAPLAAALLSLGNFTLFGLVAPSDGFVRTLQFAAGDATGVAALAPFLLVLMRYAPSVWTDDLEVKPATWRWPAVAAVFKGLILVGLLALAAFLAYFVPGDLTLDHTYVTFIPVLWIAVRYGFAWSAAAVLAVNVFIALFSLPKMGQAEGFALQFGLLTLTFVSVLLSAVVTEWNRSEARLRRHAFHDPLTGLPNRALLLDRLEQALSRNRRDTHLFALLFVDVDHFKNFNDSFGHAFGDAVLKSVAATLQNSVRPGDTVARLGGDEFVMVLERVEGLNEAVAVSNRVRAALEQPQLVADQETSVTASIGIALATDGEQSPADLLRSAGTALGRAKAAGRARHAVFDQAMLGEARERLQLENDLRRALERGEFVLHYQPIMLLGLNSAPGGRVLGDRVIGAEALLRWQHPTRGLVPPNRFVPLAETTGLIVPIGAWVMAEAFRQVRAWHEAGSSHLYMSVNLSARQLQHPGLVDSVEEILAASGLQPGHAVLELTESVLMKGFAETLAQLVALRERDVSISVDDFGTGYSSLAYLKDLPISTLKIDRSFLHGLPNDERDVGIVRAILALAYNMRLKVVAEGVETREQARFLQEHGCVQAQGYLFSRPLTAAAFTALLEQAKEGAG